MADPVYKPVVGFAKTVFRAMGLRFTMTGLDNIPRTGGAVMAVNHVGYLDFTFAGLAAQPAGRLVRFMAKEVVFRHRVSGPLMRGMKHIPVDRDAGSASFRAALTALKAGEIVGVFPEGTISHSFEIKDFKSGAVRMARSAGVPLLPTVVWGSQRIWTKGRPRSFGRHHYPVFVTVGTPIAVGRKDDPDAVNARLQATMREMLHAAQDAYPDRPRDDADRWWLPARLGGTAPTPEQALDLHAEEVRVCQAKRAARLGHAPPPPDN